MGIWECLSFRSDFSHHSFIILFNAYAKAVGEKNRLKAERARFLSGMERRAKPEIEQLLTRWGKSCVFSESTGLSLYILGVRLHRIP
ncbi:MAG: hypothetical protein WBC02_01700 [Candidatus Aminicenantaceae bacterium]